MRNVEKDWCYSEGEDRNSWLIIAKQSSRPRDLQTIAKSFFPWRIVLKVQPALWSRGKCNVCAKQSIKDSINALLMMACPSLLAPVHSDLPLLLLHAAKISPSVHPPHVSLSLSFGDGFSAKRAVRLIHFRICRFKPRKRTIATLAIRQKSGQQICLMKLKMSTRVYEN